MISTNTVLAFTGITSIFLSSLKYWAWLTNSMVSDEHVEIRTAFADGSGSATGCLVGDYCPAFTVRLHERHGVSNHWPPLCLFDILVELSTKKTSKQYITGAMCEGNPPVTHAIPWQRAINAECFSLSWRHHVMNILLLYGALFLPRL